MSTPLSKQYDPSAVEQEMLQLWNSEHLFHAEPTDEGTPYSIVIPPPNVTAALHLGHALNNTLQDILTRYHRMLGDNTVWMPGTDHAGIATQTVVDKRLQKEGKPALKDYKVMEASGERGREQFVEKVQAWKDEYEQTITNQLKRMGCSCDWDRQAFTMDEPRAKAVREAFFQLFKDGLIYRGKRLVNWDPATQTALADDEVEMEEVDGHFYYLKYPIVDSGAGGSGLGDRVSGVGMNPEPEFLTVATTRPETMLGDTAVALNPKDPRAARLRGKFVRLPIVNRVIPIIEDDYVVLPDANSDDAKARFATGFLKVTPAHDPNDYILGQKHNLPLFNVMAPDGSISDKHGWTDVGDGGFLVGMDRYVARKAVVEWFKKNSLLEDVKPYRHTVGHSYRSHVAIEPYLSDQWYLKVTDDRLAGAALRAMATEQISSDSTSADSSGEFPASDSSTSKSATSKSATSRDRKGAVPIAPSATSKPLPHVRGSSDVGYFITFSTYGTWLHGDERGSADRKHNLPGTPYLVGDEQRERAEYESLKHPQMTLDEAQRSVVLETIKEVCQQRGWTLQAAHVRTNHVHAVVIADVAPEKVMNDFKAYATRRLREAHLISDDQRVWTRHGSTRYLNADSAVEAATEYVIDRQGAALMPSPFDARVSLTASKTVLTSRDRKGAVSIDNLEEPLPHGRGSLGSSSWEGQLKFYPPRYAKTFQTWHENIRDWCISRQLWWGHRIPVWTSLINAESGRVEKVEAQLNLWLLEGRIFIQKKGIVDEGTEWLPQNARGDLVQLYVAVKPGNQNIEDWLIESRFTQDPDVLDTWFSSGLWPMSTLGWPDESAISDLKSALNTWNPTSLLTTAREIITLWVSRMVMFNLYFLNRLPFKDVFIHAMIQDGEGRKMSKSLGNGVDPLDIISSHGADAMRFTLTHMTTQTQDVRMPVVRDEKTGKNTSPKFDIGRNFCNKMWNAARFALSNLEKMSDTSDQTSRDRTSRDREGAVISADSENKTSLPDSRGSLNTSNLALFDCWILARLNATIIEVESALKSYRFDAYAKACYDFFWRDLCDWYVEAIKPAMKDPARAPQTSAVLAAALDGALRIMHPVVPFITEQLFDKLNELSADRSLPGLIALKPSARLIKADFPRVAENLPAELAAAEALVPKLQEIISAIRNIRNDHKADPKRVVSVNIQAPANLVAAIETNREVIELLGTCTIQANSPTAQAPANAAKAQAAGCELYVEGMTDAATEQQRQQKRREELTKSIAALTARLSNEAYTAKAPAKLVQQTQDQLAEQEKELASLS